MNFVCVCVWLQHTVAYPPRAASSTAAPDVPLPCAVQPNSIEFEMALHWRLVGERLRHAKAKMQARQQAALTAVLARYHKVHTADCTASQPTAVQDQVQWGNRSCNAFDVARPCQILRVATVPWHTAGQDASRAG